MTSKMSRQVPEARAGMLQAILGSTSAERVLIFLYCRNEGYARQISRFFGVALRPVQRQLEKLESAGVLFSRELGRTRLYEFNPRYPFLAELKALLGRALEFYPEPDRKALTMNRRHPRKAGKPW